MTKLIYDIKPPIPNRPLKSDLEWVALNPEAQRIIDLRPTFKNIYGKEIEKMTNAQLYGIINETPINHKITNLSQKTKLHNSPESI